MAGMADHPGGKGPSGPPEPQADAEKHQPTVLVVEDDESTRFVLTAILAEEGYLVLTAASGHDAMGTLQQPLSAIDVAILDVHLPDVNGVDLCARMRKLYPKLPVIVLTGAAQPDEIAHLLELGAHRYFQQPISRDELLATVEAALP